MRAAVILLLPLLLAACNMPLFSRSQAAVPPPALAGSTYRMVAQAGHALPEDSRYLLSFDNGRISGKLCNQFAGAYALKGELLQAQQLVSTKMFCTGKGVMPLEAALLKALEKGVTMQRDAQRLLLLDAGGQPLFSFVLFMD